MRRHSGQVEHAPDRGLAGSDGCPDLLDPQELELLPQRLRDSGPEFRDGQPWIRDDAFEPDDRLARLLTMDVEEFVLRQLSAATEPVEAPVVTPNP